MHRVIEFLKEIDRGAGNAPQELLDRILRECRRLTGAEAATIYRVREADDAPFLEPMSLQNDLIELEPMEFVVAMDETSIAGYVALTGQAVLIDDAYAIPSGRPFIFNASFDVATGYRTGSVACIALRRSQGDVCAVVQLINSRDPAGAAVPFAADEIEIIEAAGLIVSSAIERAEMLERLERQNRELTRQFATIEALQHETETALTNARKSDRAKAELLNCIGHELRTPLNSIIGFSELLKNEGFGPLGHPSYAAFATDIAAGGHQLLRIVNDILAIVRADSNVRKLRDDGRAAYGCVEDTARAFFETAAEANLVLAAEIAEEPASCAVDRTALQTALERLIDNAIKFTPAGGEIVVTVGPTEEGGLAIEVRDTGIGMTDAEIEVAFTPFGQIDSSLGREYEGAGLGLTLAAAIARGMNGDLTITSQPGEGTAVRLSFPPSNADLRNLPSERDEPKSATS